MKLSTKDVIAPVLSGVTTTSTFSIRNSAKAFSILSGGLYTNKIKAIIRELSCNAIDSHKEAGKEDVPFIVHLPNALEPWFSVRDYGIGLDHKGVTQLYTTYFESTKQDSNDYIGALGLGSKSPFSYTDNFTVIAIKDGIQRIYTAFINETGCPEIATMGECETDEVNGVEVKFSVKETYDFRRFRQEAVDVYKWFKNLPVVIGSSDFNPQQPEYRNKNISTGAHLLEIGNVPLAIQGNVAYPIILSNLGNIDHILYLFKCPLVVEFEIGELDITANREGLSYVQWTIDNIVKRFERINDEICKYIESEVKGIKGHWELATKLSSLHKLLIFKNGVETYINAHDVKLLELIDFHTLSTARALDIPDDFFTKNHIKCRMFNVSSCSSGLTVTAQKKLHDSYLMPFSTRVIVVINDTNKGAITRLRNHFKHTNWRPDGTKWKAFTVIYLQVDKEHINKRDKLYKKFFRKTYNPPYVKMLASELDKPTRITDAGLCLNKMLLRKSRYSAQWSWTKVRDTIESSNTHCYVPISNYTVLNLDGTVNHGFIKELWPLIHGSGILGTVDHIYGVHKKFIKVFQGKTNWVCFYSLLKDKIENYDTSLLSYGSYIKTVNSDIINKYTIKQLDKFDSTSPFRAILEKVEPAFSSDINTIQFSAIRRILIKFGVDIGDVAAKENEFVKEYKAINSIYPMLRFVNNIHIRMNDNIELIINYINMIDNQRSTDK